MNELFRSIKNPFSESLPEDLISKYNLIDKNKALKNIHFPHNQDTLIAAQNRLKYEELFFIQLQLLMKNRQRKQNIKGFVFEKVKDYFNTFFNTKLPFELTNAQKRVIKEIRKDIGNGQHEPITSGRCGFRKNGSITYGYVDCSRQWISILLNGSYRNSR